MRSAENSPCTGQNVEIDFQVLQLLQEVERLSILKRKQQTSVKKMLPEAAKYLFLLFPPRTVPLDVIFVSFLWIFSTSASTFILSRSLHGITSLIDFIKRGAEKKC